MKYDAFISYRHAELDQFVAENLHKKLEAFRLPKSIVRQRGRDCKKKIERVFRDRDELPLATNLADPITDALENSEFLIVICSPRLPQSLWCKKEIETFISMHGRERVLAVLIEGEPEESFPEELLYRTRELTHEEGTVEVIKEPVEPLAADVRGKTKKEVLKKMDEELLRLTAAMFECAYDDLKQRHKEQKMKKMLTMSLAASAFFLVFGAVSTTMAIRIQSQKEQIQTQSEEIQAQKEEIEVQYQQALYNQSLSMAEDSLELLAEGDRLGALQMAYAALGETEDGTPMPITAEAQYALAESSYLYKDGQSLIPVYMFKHDTNVSMLEVSPNRERMLTADQYGNIFVWDVLKNEVIAQFSGEYFSEPTNTTCFWLNDNQVLYNGESSFEVYDIEQQKVVYTGTDIFYKGMSTEHGKWFAAVLDETMWVYETATFTPLYSYDLPEEKNFEDAMVFDPNGNYFAFALRHGISVKEPGAQIVVMSLETGEIAGELEVKYSSVEKLDIVEDVLVACVNQDVDDAFPDGNFDLSTPFMSCLYTFNLDDMSIKWTYENKAESAYDIQINAADYSRHMLVCYYSEAHILDLDTGAMEFKTALGDQIISSFYYTNNDIFAVTTRKGEYHVLNGTAGTNILFEGYFQSNSSNLECMDVVGNGFVTLPDSATAVTYYEYAAGEGYADLATMNELVEEIFVNKAENRAVIALYGGEEGTEVCLVDMDMREPIKSIVEDHYTVNVGMVEDGSQYFYVWAGQKLRLYQIEDGSLHTEYDLPDLITPDYIATSEDGKSLVIRENQKFWKINFADGATEELQFHVDRDELLPSAVSSDCSYCVVADKEEKALMFYSGGAEEPLKRIDLNASFVNQLTFTQDGSHLLVLYMDGSAEMYEVESGTCVEEYSYLGKDLEALITLGNNAGYLVKDISVGYMLNEEFELVARILDCEAIMPKTKQFICTDSEKVYTIPFYTLEEMLEKAEQILVELNALE